MTAPTAPLTPQATPVASTAIDISWTPPLDPGSTPVSDYQVRLIGPLGDEPWLSVGLVAGYRMLGLLQGTRYGFQVRAVNTSGPGAVSPVVYAMPEARPVLRSGLGTQLDLLDEARQSLIHRLPTVDVRIEVWWQDDGHWYANLEAPVNTRQVSGKRLVVGAGLLDRIGDVLAGNYVLRALGEDFQDHDPGRDAWEQNTHGLMWEPTPS